MPSEHLFVPLKSGFHENCSPKSDFPSWMQKNHKVKEENREAPANNFRANNVQRSQHKGRKKDSARRGRLGCAFVCSWHFGVSEKQGGLSEDQSQRASLRAFSTLNRQEASDPRCPQSSNFIQLNARPRCHPYQVGVSCTPRAVARSAFEAVAWRSHNVYYLCLFPHSLIHFYLRQACQL